MPTVTLEKGTPVAETEITGALYRIGNEVRELRSRLESLEKNHSAHDRDLAVGEEKMKHLEVAVATLTKVTEELHRNIDIMTAQINAIVPSFKEMLGSHEQKEKEAQVTILKNHLDGIRTMALNVAGAVVSKLLIVGIIFVCIRYFPEIETLIKAILG